MEELMLVNPIFDDWLEDEEEDDMDWDLLPSYAKPKARRRRNPSEGGPDGGLMLLGLLGIGYIIWCAIVSRNKQWSWTPWQSHQLARPPMAQLPEAGLQIGHGGTRGIGEPRLYPGEPGGQPVVVTVT